MNNSYFKWLLESYQYDSMKEFLLSLFPSFKYELQSLSISLSFISASFTFLLGIGPALAFAMMVAIIVETVTGIKASRMRKEKFQSFKFSRCIIKVAVWYALLYFTNAFASEFDSKDSLDIIACYFFLFIRILILTYFFIEYLTSILENLAVIDGKPKDSLIQVVKDNWKLLTQKLNRKS